MAEVGTKRVFENERVRVWELTLQPALYDAVRWLGMGLVALVPVACSYTQVKDGLYVQDTLPDGQPRGYAEFRLDPIIRNAPAFEKSGSVWITWEKEYAESTFKKRPFDLTASQAVRFALPQGTQYFFIGSVGRAHRNVPVEVREGHITPVLVRVVGQTERATVSTSTYSGAAVTTTQTTRGVAYDWVVEWQVAKPVPIASAR
jgi:hypothetical protein